VDHYWTVRMLPALTDLYTMITAELDEQQQSQGRVETHACVDSPFCKWSTIFWMVLIAFAVRISFLLLLRTYSFERADDYGVGEINNIAASIAKGLGFSSPFSSEYTGPTSWVAPVLVLLQLASAQKRLAQTCADFPAGLHNRDFSVARA